MCFNKSVFYWTFCQLLYSRKKPNCTKIETCNISGIIAVNTDAAVSVFKCLLPNSFSNQVSYFHRDTLFVIKVVASQYFIFLVTYEWA